MTQLRPESDEISYMTIAAILKMFLGGVSHVVLVVAMTT